MKASYKRIILKFSGEMLKSPHSSDTFSTDIILSLCQTLKQLHASGYEIGIVLGGGNIFRGLSGNQRFGIDRVSGDYMGMLATIINVLAVQSGLESLGVPSKILTSFAIPPVTEAFEPLKAKHYFQQGHILLLGGGTGSPFFSTDSAAALRANELHADVVVKCTKVNGVFDKDPEKYKDAQRYEHISFEDVLIKRLKVMDSTAFSLCMDNNIPIIVIDAKSDLNNIKSVLEEEPLGTVISNF